jgi:transcriptional regulator with XRE-family HTH domain
MSLDMAEFARFIEDARKAEGISAKELGTLAKIKTTLNITRIERGKVTNPTFDTVVRLMMAINELPVVRNGEFNFDGYSKGLIEMLNRFRDDADKIKYESPVESASLPECLANVTNLELEQACAMVVLNKEFPSCRKALHDLCTQMDVQQIDRARMDYSDLINDLTKRNGNPFYRQANDMLHKYVNTKDCSHAYEFMTMLLQNISLSLEEYVHNNPVLASNEERAVSRYRRRKGEAAASLSQ